MRRLTELSTIDEQHLRFQARCFLRSPEQPSTTPGDRTAKKRSEASAEEVAAKELVRADEVDPRHRKIDLASHLGPRGQRRAVIMRKRQRLLGEVDEVVLSLYVKELTTGGMRMTSGDDQPRD